MSLLMDGDAAPDALAGHVMSACTAWQFDAQWRADWHAYHLIGDALRSEELAQSALRDGAFMRSLRARLADEPVVLAPASEAAPQPARALADVAAVRRGPRWWVAPAAVAAGFAVVTSALVTFGLPGVTPEAPPLAAAPADGAGAVLASAPAASAAASQASFGWESGPAASWAGLPQASDSALRDVRMDSDLSVHRRISSQMSMAPPGAFVRSMETLDLNNK